MRLLLVSASCLVGAVRLPAAGVGSDVASTVASTDAFWRGKRVLLAGASSGLGEALAAELHGRGASLALAARRADRLTAVAEACARVDSTSAPPAVLPMDVSNSPDLLEAQAAEAAALLDGPIDVLCYAAGVGQRTLATDTDAAGHQQLMATNFEGAVTLTRAVLPSMIERGTGHLIVVSSVQGFFGQPGRSSYAASKVCCEPTTSVCARFAARSAAAATARTEMGRRADVLPSISIALFARRPP